MDSETKKIIDLLATQEEYVCLLYHTYSLKFPDHTFWTEMSKAESVHQQWILSLSNNPEIVFDKNRFSISSLEGQINYIKQQIDNASNISLIEALGLSLDLEKSLIENKYFTVFDSDSLALKKVFSALENETKNHIEKVSSELANTQMTQQ